MAVDLGNDVILVTCASGKQASTLIPVLQAKWKRLRLVVHSDASAQRLRGQYPDAEVVQANLNVLADTKRIVKGVSAVYYVGPPGNPHEAQCGFNMVDAAVAESDQGDFKHFVMSSVFPTQLRKLMNHECKGYVEEYLMESGLNYTILQPSHYFENTPVPFFMQQEAPVYPIPYNPDIKFSFTALRDLADVAAKVLGERDKHYFAVYPVISTPPTQYHEFLEIVGKAMGKPIKIERKSIDESVAFIMNRFGGGNDPRRVDIFERLLLYYDRRGIWGNTGVTEWLLERKPTSCEEWARLQVAAAKGPSK